MNKGRFGRMDAISFANRGLVAATSLVMLATADGDFGVVPADVAAIEAQEMADDLG